MSDYTPIPVAKWTKSSLIKCLERYYAISLDRLLNSDLPRNEMIKRSDSLLKNFLSIYNPIMEYGVTVKKQ